MSDVTRNQQRGAITLIGALFLIIILILGFVFWINPKGRMTRGKAVRRAAADVGLAMLVIVLSITWMNGVGVLLGPKYLGIIGNFSEILQIIPILLIGLGVDYAIHLTSRFHYEFERCGRYEEALRASLEDVGRALFITSVALVLGFLCLTFSVMASSITFGVLLSLTIVVALVADFLLMPALVLTFQPFGPEGGRARAPEAQLPEAA